MRLVEELSLCELVSEDVRPRPAALVAAMRSSNRTPDLGEVLWESVSRISVNLEEDILCCVRSSESEAKRKTVQRNEGNECSQALIVQ